jgi:hypothetical protein
MSASLVGETAVASVNHVRGATLACGGDAIVSMHLAPINKGVSYRQIHAAVVDFCFQV